MCLKIWLGVLLIGVCLYAAEGGLVKRSFSDHSVRGYLTERVCWANEVCKEEFHSQFRCKCPTFSVCRSAGRYYNAYCSINNTGYIWTQPLAPTLADERTK